MPSLTAATKRTMAKKMKMERMVKNRRNTVNKQS